VFNTLNNKRHIALKRKVLDAMRIAVKRLTINKQMKHFSRFYFIDKVLRKTLNAIRHYSLLSKMGNHLKVKSMSDCFSVLKHYAEVKKGVRYF
jgi:hypothetical protein